MYVKADGSGRSGRLEAVMVLTFAQRTDLLRSARRELDRMQRRRTTLDDGSPLRTGRRLAELGLVELCLIQRYPRVLVYVPTPAGMELASRLASDPALAAAAVRLGMARASAPAEP